MTKEDAWRKAKGYLYDVLTGDEADEIIKALEQDEDCVSRKTAIIQLSHNKIGDDDCDVIIQKDIETIKALPPAAPQQKMGRWIVVETLHGEWEGTKKYACDNCGEKVGVFKSNYCPNCGIKMEV